MKKTAGKTAKNNWKIAGKLLENCWKILSADCLKVPTRWNVRYGISAGNQDHKINFTREFNWRIQKREASRELFFLKSIALRVKARH